MSPTTVKPKNPFALRFDFHTDHTSATFHSTQDQFFPIHVAAFPEQATCEGSDTWDYFFMLGYPISGCSDGFQPKRPGAGAGAAVHDASDPPWETDEVMMPLWPRSVGIAWVNAPSPYGHIWAVMSVRGDCKFEHRKVCSPIKFHPLSLLPLASLSSPGTAGDGSPLALTCGEQCHVKFLGWLLTLTQVLKNLKIQYINDVYRKFLKYLLLLPLSVSNCFHPAVIQLFELEDNHGLGIENSLNEKWSHWIKTLQTWRKQSFSTETISKFTVFSSFILLVFFLLPSTFIPLPEVRKVFRSVTWAKVTILQFRNTLNNL